MADDSDATLERLSYAGDVEIIDVSAPDADAATSAVCDGVVEVTVVFVHGTGSSADVFSADMRSVLMSLVAPIYPPDAVMAVQEDQVCGWSGGVTESARVDAGRVFAARLYGLGLATCDPLQRQFLLVGHSHGATVLLKALALVAQRFPDACLDDRVAFVSLAAPAVAAEEQFLIDTPRARPRVWLNVFNLNDVVAAAASALANSEDTVSATVDVWDSLYAARAGATKTILAATMPMATLIKKLVFSADAWEAADGQGPALQPAKVLEDRVISDIVRFSAKRLAVNVAVVRSRDLPGDEGSGLLSDPTLIAAGLAMTGLSPLICGPLAIAWQSTNNHVMKTFCEEVMHLDRDDLRRLIVLADAQTSQGRPFEHVHDNLAELAFVNDSGGGDVAGGANHDDVKDVDVTDDDVTDDGGDGMVFWRRIHAWCRPELRQLFVMDSNDEDDDGGAETSRDDGGEGASGLGGAPSSATETT